MRFFDACVENINLQSIEDVVIEAEKLAAKGVKELILIAQDFNY
jgi:tRNA A37 methylthiotransferase MiaB